MTLQPRRGSPHTALVAMRSERSTGGPLMLSPKATLLALASLLAAATGPSLALACTGPGCGSLRIRAAGPISFEDSEKMFGDVSHVHSPADVPGRWEPFLESDSASGAGRFDFKGLPEQAVLDIAAAGDGQGAAKATVEGLRPDPADRETVLGAAGLPVSQDGKGLRFAWKPGARGAKGSSADFECKVALAKEWLFCRIQFQPAPSRGGAAKTLILGFVKR